MNDEADTLYDLMPKTYRQRVTRDQFRFLFPRLIERVVAEPAGRKLARADAASPPKPFRNQRHKRQSEYEARPAAEKW